MVRRLLTLALCLAALTPRAEELIKIAMEGKYPPFEEMDSKGNLRGFNVDIAQALCAEMKAKCQLVRFDWNELIPAMKAKKADAILASMSITPERLKDVDFSNYYAKTPAYFVAKARKIPYVYITPKRLAGMKIGVLKDSTYDRYVTARFGATSTPVRFEDGDKVYAALLDGKVDLIMDDAVVAYYSFLQTEKGKGYGLVGSAVAETKYFGEGQGIAFRKGETALKERFNKALATILDNGVYNEISRKYFIFRVY